MDLGTFGGNASNAYGLNDSGQVVGGAQTAASKLHAYVWTDANGNLAVDAGEMLDLDLWGGDNSRANGINNAGDVVGYAANALGEIRAFLYQDGEMFDLNDLLPAGNGWELQEGWDIKRERPDYWNWAKTPAELTHSFSAYAGAVSFTGRRQS